MAKKPLPCPTLLRLLLTYEPETGKLFWKERPRWVFKTRRSASVTNARFSGAPAFNSISDEGYRVGRFMGRTLKAHRVVWALEHGAWPDGVIDHINGNREDNRASNLREATFSENAINTAPRRNFSGAPAASQFAGVGRAPSGRWRARIRTNSRLIHIGVFNSQTEAARAYDAAAKVHHGEFARLNFPE